MTIARAPIGGKRTAGGDVLDDAVAAIAELRDLAGLRIDDLHVCSPFTVVRLSDGAFGSAGNYAVQGRVDDYDAATARRSMLTRAGRDPLLLATLSAPRSPMERSLRVAIVSALSQPLLDQGTAGSGFVDEAIADPHDAITSLVRAGDRVAIVGFGGPMARILARPAAARVDVVDELIAHDGTGAMLREELLRGGGRMEIAHLHAAADSSNLGAADVCVITGSSLCNGTMERLLSLAAGAREIVVQGPSASIIPGSLFRRGCTVLMTTRKSAAEFDAGTRPTEEVYDYADRAYRRITPARTA